jgi:NADH-quinone oxidoreductase subunit E
MNSTFDYSKLDNILKNHEYNASNIIAILQDTQETYRYLPKEIFTYLSEKLGISRAKIYSVATFYENFSLEPKGKYIIRICDGTACHVRKSIPILDKLRKELGLSETKHTTEDLMYTVETVSCLGACGLAPAITVNEKVYGAMTPEKALELLNTLKGEE